MGFRIGYTGHGATPHSCGRNHPSSLANEEVVLKGIAAEVTAGKLHGPLTAQLLPQVHVSPLGLVPKAHMANLVQPVLIALCIHPSDYHLLGIRWRDRTYVDRALPFGLRSAPKIFSALAGLVAWVLDQLGIRSTGNKTPATLSR